MDNTVRHTVLIAPYGDRLVNLIVPEEDRHEVLHRAKELPYVQISLRSLCDLELMATGAFSPLARFMSKADYTRVLEEMRLADGTLFPIPITLSVTETKGIQLGKEIALRSLRNELIAVMSIEEVFESDHNYEASHVYKTDDSRHPLVAEMATWGKYCISGPLKVVGLPKHFDFCELRKTPAEVRSLLEQYKRPNVVAFHTRNLIHRAHEELTKRAANAVGGTLLLHPTVGLVMPGDADHYARVRSYKAVIKKYYQPQPSVLSVLPLAMRFAGPREAVWHAITRRNYGANYFIVGRDHASPGRNSRGQPFYGPYEAQELLDQVSDEIGVRMIASQELVYVPEEGSYEEIDRVPAGKTYLMISGTKLRNEYLAHRKSIPEWFLRPEAAQILEEIHAPLHKRGVCIWFTGLPGCGKSTLAEMLTTMLTEYGRQVTWLDGDVVRTHLSAGLGFTKEDRDRNILQIGFVASEVVRHGGIAVCAAVSPYRAIRDQVRNIVGKGNFVLVFVDTPLEVCEQRDSKGLYNRARRGEIERLTGIGDPYEVPVMPEITVTTTTRPPEEVVQEIIRYLVEKGFLPNKPVIDTGS